MSDFKKKKKQPTDPQYYSTSIVPGRHLPLKRKSFRKAPSCNCGCIMSHCSVMSDKQKNPKYSEIFVR